MKISCYLVQVYTSIQYICPGKGANLKSMLKQDDTSLRRIRCGFGTNDAKSINRPQKDLVCVCNTKRSHYIIL